MSQETKKQRAAHAALEFVNPGDVIGLGTGSTANYFIDALADGGVRIAAAVASSRASAERARRHGITVIDLNDAPRLSLYVDGADEATAARRLIKGGGGALTREKIVAAAADVFVCIADDSKKVECLGRFPLPVEVIPMARTLVCDGLRRLGGRAVLRDAFVTDNGNCILDVHDLVITDPVSLESELDHLTGCVCNGLFARRPADVLLFGTDHGVQRI